MHAQIQDVRWCRAAKLPSCIDTATDRCSSLEVLWQYTCLGACTCAACCASTPGPWQPSAVPGPPHPPAQEAGQAAPAAPRLAAPPLADTQHPCPAAHTQAAQKVSVRLLKPATFIGAVPSNARSCTSTSVKHDSCLHVIPVEN